MIAQTILVYGLDHRPRLYAGTSSWIAHMIGYFVTETQFDKIEIYENEVLIRTVLRMEKEEFDWKKEGF